MRSELAVFTMFGMLVVSVSHCSNSPSSGGGGGQTDSGGLTDSGPADGGGDAYPGESTLCPQGIQGLYLDGGTDAAAVCTYTPNIATLIPTYGMSAPLPTGSGGTVVPGTYVITAAGVYGVPAAEVGYLQSQVAQTLVIGAATGSNTYPVNYNQTFVYGCVGTVPNITNNTLTITPPNSLTLTQTCPADPTGKLTEVGTFTASTNDAGVTTFTSYLTTLGGAPFNEYFTLTLVHP